MIEWYQNMIPLGAFYEKRRATHSRNDLYQFKKNFNLNDLIGEFDISRSTALRDISSLEELGVPLYSEKEVMVISC